MSPAFLALDPNFQLTKLPTAANNLPTSKTGSFMEVVSYLCASPYQSVPPEVCYILAHFMRGYCESIPTAERQYLLPATEYWVDSYHPRTVVQRLRLVVELAVCEAAPLALDRLGLVDHAQTLRQLRGCDYEQPMRLPVIAAIEATENLNFKGFRKLQAAADVAIVNRANSCSSYAMAYLPHWAAYSAGIAAAILPQAQVIETLEQLFKCPATGDYQPLSEFTKDGFTFNALELEPT